MQSLRQITMPLEVILQAPVTAKKTFSPPPTEDFFVAASSSQGWRVTMEDAHCIVTGSSADRIHAYFAVFDGHGGSSIADYASKHLHHRIRQELESLRGDVKAALEEAFVKLDATMSVSSKYGRSGAGSTAVVVLICEGRLYCANVGDSRAVVFEHGRVVPLSLDHKPSLPAEYRRIVGAGGFVSYDRVNGNLAMSRSLGDFAFKKNLHKSKTEQQVIPFPDVTMTTVDKFFEFLVLACDGIWDVMSNEVVCTFVKERLGKMSPGAICEELLNACLYKLQPTYESVGTDNMTVILVIFRNSIYKPYVDTEEETASSLHYICNQVECE